jgi:hypothetical protein
MELQNLRLFQVMLTLSLLIQGTQFEIQRGSSATLFPGCNSGNMGTIRTLFYEARQGSQMSCEFSQVSTFLSPTLLLTAAEF